MTAAEALQRADDYGLQLRLYATAGHQEAQSKLGFPLHEGEHCRRCAFFGDVCPAMYS